jgi:hypothetical protein
VKGVLLLACVTTLFFPFVSHAESVTLEWVYPPRAEAPLTRFGVQSCLVADIGKPCRPIGEGFIVGPLQRQAVIALKAVPRGWQCFQIIAMFRGVRSSPSNRVCVDLTRKALHATTLHLDIPVDGG